MIDPRLITQGRRLLAKLSVLSEVPASRPGAVGHGHPSSSPPRGSGSSIFDRARARIDTAIAAGNESGLREAIDWARGELDAIRKRPPVEAETRAQFRYRLATEYPGVPAPVVARKEKTSVTTVREARIEHGRDARLGHRLPDEESNTEGGES